MPAHLYATIKAAYEHPGFSFVKVIMRCTKFMPDLIQELTGDREHTHLLSHEKGIPVDEATSRLYKNQLEHDPSDINQARRLAEIEDIRYLGLFYQNKEAKRYDEYGAHNLGLPKEEKLAAINREFDRYAI